jgi:hypothetical protein
MTNSRPTADRIFVSLSIFSALMLMLLLLVFLGAITERFSSGRLLENLGAEWTMPLLASGWTRLFLSADMPPQSYGTGAVLDRIVFLSIAALLLVIAAGSAAAYRHLRELPAVNEGAWQRRVWLIHRAAAIFMAAGFTAVVLEAARLWKRLVPHPDPFMDKGAPIWIWWTLLAIWCFLWFIPHRKEFQTPARSLRMALIVTLGALLFAAAAAVLHAVRPEPVQGRYYKIPGFIVGRQFPNEYGTYYGVTAGATAAILALAALAMTLRRALGLIKSRRHS